MEWADTSPPPVEEHPITYKQSIKSTLNNHVGLQRYLSHQQSDHSAAIADQILNGFPEEPFDELKFQGYAISE